MKKFFTVLLSLFTFASHAGTDLGSALKKMLEEYHYAMIVEWDQKDKLFFDQQQDKLRSNIKALTAAGMSYETVITAIKETTKRERELQSMEFEVTLMGKNPTEEELESFILKKHEQFYSRGASWNGLNGDTIGGIILAGLFGALIISIAISCGIPCDDSSSEESDPGFLCQPGCTEDTNGYVSCWSC